MPMSKIVLYMTMSVDGYIAGPQDSAEAPLQKKCNRPLNKIALPAAREFHRTMSRTPKKL